MEEATELRVVVWNTEWASPESRSGRGHIIRREILSVDPDIVCLTEAVPALLPDHGHVIEPADPAPYTRGDGGQKVLLWSRWPWQHVTGELPKGTTGRFVEGVTGPPDTSIRFTGVCIPWHDSQVRTGRKNRERWEDHIDFIHALGPRSIAGPTDIPEVMLGDYNQRIPKGWQPIRAFEALMEHLEGWDVPTAGEREPGGALIDHMALRGGLAGELEHIWPTHLEDTRLSDHVGLKLRLTAPARMTVGPLATGTSTRVSR
jgi:endonuclease/exonuclease/phosphatase family metal-dependent hydrolase